MTTAIWPNNSFLHQFAYSSSIGGITWAVIECGRFVVRKPDDPGGWPKGIRGILLTVVGIGVGFFLGSMIGDAFFTGDAYASWMDSKRDQRISWLITVLAGVSGSYFFYSRGHRNALAARVNAAERDASEAKLKLLETQLEPHMLFNTLANLRVLITTDPPRAVAMLDRLNSYLRATLSGSRAVAHPLAAEFELLRDYLELMSVRMGDRLKYTLDLPDDLRDVSVPPLLLQPLVENAIQHGLEPKVGGGSITVRASQRGPLLVIEVDDSGVGLSSQADDTLENARPGFGLTQVRERLASAFGSQGAIRLKANPAGGASAIASFPLTHSVQPAQVQAD
ncbi:histidine kinase [Variovorax humicola]|uniref:Histidine kinase n=1 Tax=Variovorax humicola TaxID=1769758 RepID=A0ABU8W2V9_9BURK